MDWAGFQLQNHFPLISVFIGNVFSLEVNNNLKIDTGESNSILLSEIGDQHNPYFIAPICTNELIKAPFLLILLKCIVTVFYNSITESVPQVTMNVRHWNFFPNVWIQRHNTVFMLDTIEPDCRSATICNKAKRMYTVLVGRFSLNSHTTMMMWDIWEN